MNDKVISFVMTVDSEQARKWLEENNYPNNRQLRRKNVDFLKRTMVTGQFIAGDGIYFGVCNGHEYLLNGQHRLTAIAETGVPQEMAVVYNQVDSFSEMAHIYASFDKPLRRKMHDTIIAHGLDKETGLPDQQLEKSSSAIRMIMAGFSPAGITRYHEDEVVIMEQIRHYQDSIRIYFDLIVGCDKRMRDIMMRRSNLSIALVTIDEAVKFLDRDFVCNFWRSVAIGSGLVRGDPRFWLHEKMLTTRIRGGWGAGLAQQLSIIDAARMTAMAWNYYAEKRPIVRITMPESEIKIKFTSRSIPKKQQGDK